MKKKKQKVLQGKVMAKLLKKLIYIEEKIKQKSTEWK